MVVWNDPMLYKFGGGCLPSSYQQVEWISNEHIADNETLEAYIVTNLHLTQQSVIRCKYKRFVNSGYLSTYGSPFGTWRSGSQLLIESRKVSSTIFKVAFGNTGEKSCVFDDTTNPIEVEVSQSGVVVDGGTVFTFTNPVVTENQNNPIALFGFMGASEVSRSKIRMYSFSIDVGSLKTADIVPCYRKSDGEIGMYDIVGGVFYVNAATRSKGTFSKGPDVN